MTYQAVTYQAVGSIAVACHSLASDRPVGYVATCITVTDEFSKLGACGASYLETPS